MNHTPLRLTAACALLLLALAGCSSDGRMAASGTVTLDGKPLEMGAITFLPAPGSEGHSAGGQIANGEFYLPAAHGLQPGKYLVTIQTFKRTGRMVQRLMGMVPEQVPVNFSEAGKLEATLAAGAANRFDFKLTSVSDAR